MLLRLWRLGAAMYRPNALPSHPAPAGGGSIVTAWPSIVRSNRFGKRGVLKRRQFRSTKLEPQPLKAKSLTQKFAASRRVT